jgi:hypothetical protein
MGNTNLPQKRPSAELTQELRGRALHHALWIALLHAQDLGFADIQGQLTSILVDVNERRDALEAAA